MNNPFMVTYPIVGAVSEEEIRKTRVTLWGSVIIYRIQQVFFRLILKWFTLGEILIDKGKLFQNFTDLKKWRQEFGNTRDRSYPITLADVTSNIAVIYLK